MHAPHLDEAVVDRQRIRHMAPPLRIRLARQQLQLRLADAAAAARRRRCLHGVHSCRLLAVGQQHGCRQAEMEGGREGGGCWCSG
jgi:hypothetical protein